VARLFLIEATIHPYKSATVDRRKSICASRRLEDFAFSANTIATFQLSPSQFSLNNGQP
jgi:hypothetical protein